MPRYIVTLTNDEIQELKALIQKGRKGYRIKHAQILLKSDQKPENEAWIYDRICDAYGTSHATIANIAQRYGYALYPVLFLPPEPRAGRCRLSQTN